VARPGVFFENFEAERAMAETNLTAEEVAATLQVTVQTVSNYCKAGVFPNAFKAGPGRTSPWRIPRRDLDLFLKKQKQRAQAASA
jgi:predicted DNA-binding transcriptional regulator AlpA